MTYAIGYPGDPAVIISHHTTSGDARAAAENVLMDLFGSGGIHKTKGGRLQWRWDAKGKLFFRVTERAGGYCAAPIQPLHPLPGQPDFGEELSWPDGRYEVYDRHSGAVHEREIYSVASAKFACAQRFRATDGKDDMYDIEWKHNRLMYTYKVGAQTIERFSRFQIRPAGSGAKDEKAEDAPGEVEPRNHEGGYAFEATFCGERYTFDPFGSPLEAAVWGLISECNHTTDYWKGFATKNSEGEFSDEGERRISKEMALLVGGKMQGYQECLRKILFAMGKRPQS